MSARNSLNLSWRGQEVSVFGQLDSCKFPTEAIMGAQNFNLNTTKIGDFQPHFFSFRNNISRQKRFPTGIAFSHHGSHHCKEWNLQGNRLANKGYIFT